jgi:hypothetical protein
VIISRISHPFECLENQMGRKSLKEPTVGEIYRVAKK